MMAFGDAVRIEAAANKDTLWWKSSSKKNFPTKCLVEDKQDDWRADACPKQRAFNKLHLQLCKWRSRVLQKLNNVV